MAKDPATFRARPWVARRAMLAALGPTALLVVAPDRSALHAVVACAAAVTLSAIPALDDRGRRFSLVLASVAIGAVTALGIVDRLDRPGQVLSLWTATVAALAQLWVPRGLAPYASVQTAPTLALRGASLTALGSLVLAQLIGPGSPLSVYGAALLLVAWFPPWLALRHGLAALPSAGIALLLPAVVAAGALWTDAGWQPWLLAVGPAGLALTSYLTPTERAEASLLELLTARPAPLLVASFGVLCTAGTALLVLPGMTPAARDVSLLDAAFTAVSASCVTGLIVLDTPNDLTLQGQLVILVLIQIGGIGIMTFSTLIFSVLGRRMSLQHEATAAELLGARAQTQLLGSLRRIGLITAATEGTGALFLLPLFLAHGDSFPQAVWRAVFTAISAFCNAGFALQTDSLAPYRDDPLVLGVVGTLIVLGGLGPLVVAAIPLLRRRSQVSLHVRLALTTSAVLILAPGVLFTALEWPNTLAPLSPFNRAINGLFQVISFRTAGFATLDAGELAPATWTLSLILMFIGGSPGSTAGGLKTTTLAVLILAIVAALQGRPEVRAFGRFVPYRTVQEAASLATVGVGGVLTTLVILQLTQPIELPLALFEAVSALATVGASAGATAELDSVGKVVIMGCMFAGRVGPMTVLALLASVHPEPRLRYPEAHVPVG